MKRIRALVAVAVLAALLPLAGTQAQQQITDAHLRAAVEAYRALGTDGDFDIVLPGVAEQVATVLIQQRPDLHQIISQVVNQVAFELAARRADLTNDVARVWAQAFTEQELRAITAFYRSGRTDLLERYSTTCLRRVWKAQRFSWWMTQLFHLDPSHNAFDRKRQVAELDYVTSSQAAARSLAENYVGLPVES